MSARPAVVQRCSEMMPHACIAGQAGRAHGGGGGRSSRGNRQRTPTNTNMADDIPLQSHSFPHPPCPPRFAGSLYWSLYWHCSFTAWTAASHVRARFTAVDPNTTSHGGDGRIRSTVRIRGGGSRKFTTSFQALILSDASSGGGWGGRGPRPASGTNLHLGASLWSAAKRLWRWCYVVPMRLCRLIYTL